MTRKILTILSIACMLMLFVQSCKSTQGQSPTTGWGVNDPEWGGFQIVDQYTQPVPLNMSFIEGGRFVMGNNEQDLLFEYNALPRPVTVSSFYMDEVETSNAAYQEYTYWLERIYGLDYPEVVRSAQPDVLAWNDIASFRDAMSGNYFVHPAYVNYPVVGVTWDQANNYCSWRTDRVNEKILIDAKIINLELAQTADNNFNTEAYLAGQFSGNVNKGLQDLNPNASEQLRAVRKSDGIFIEKLRLPTEAEWEYAAYALIGNSSQERVLERKIYPWNTSSVRSSDINYMGEFMANFSRGSGDMMGTAGALNDGAEYTAEVYSYFPNDFGLYNMAGNVAEWCLDVYRPLTQEDADGLNPYRGNVYETVVRDEDGLIAEKDSLGRIEYREYTAEELAGRRNFTKSDNRNYLDGDYESAIVDDWHTRPPGLKSATSLLYEYGKNSLISDKARVVKGGSWKDRVYYMSPGTRRHLEQDLSADWIGFRCAMSRLGTANQGSVSAR